jgi:hypothetical protein
VLYEKQAAKLIHTGESTSIGWRYLDKFVQMPLVLPSPSGSIRTGYVSKLLALGVSKTVTGAEALASPHYIKSQDGDFGSAVGKVLDAAMPSLPKVIDPAVIASSIAENKVRREWYAEVDQRVREFDEDTGLVEEILEMLPDFLSNPRDLKRWLNVFRYHYFVQSGPKRQIDLKLLAVKVGLELQWPDALRCIERTRATDGASTLAALVESAVGSPNVDGWQETLRRDWGVPETYGWTKDLRLYSFLKEPFRVRQGVSFLG